MSTSILTRDEWVDELANHLMNRGGKMKFVDKDVFLWIGTVPIDVSKISVIPAASRRICEFILCPIRHQIEN